MQYFREKIIVRLQSDKLFLLHAEEKQLFRQKLQTRPKKLGWSNDTARGSGEGHCSQYRCIISSVEAIETSTITVVYIP